MIKKLIAALLVSATVITLVSCMDSSTDTGANETKADTAADTAVDTSAETAEQTDKAEETEDGMTTGTSDAPASDNPAVNLLNTIKQAGENMTLANVYDSVDAPLSAINFVSFFGGEIDFDENFEPIFPEILSKIEAYAFLMPVGKSPIEIDVFKVKDTADIDAVKDLCQDRIQRIKESDIKVYSPDVCDVIFPLMTVYAKGDYVMMISVENPEDVKAAADTALAQ